MSISQGVEPFYLNNFVLHCISTSHDDVISLQAQFVHNILTKLMKSIRISFLTSLTGLYLTVVDMLLSYLQYAIFL